jgi:large subunit ribosomal protein L1
MTHTKKDGKKYADAVRRFDRQQQHGPGEAIDLVKSLASARFDETVEVAVRLGVDPRKADQIVRGTVGLPAGTGKSVRVVAFAAGPAAAEAREAGADVVGADDLVERVQGGFLEFDVAIASPDLMGQVGKLGRILGPRGLMPNPKTGTVTTDVGKAVREFKGGRVEYRTDRYGNIHVPIGKVSFERRSLLENLRAVMDELNRAKPAAAKGRYVQGITVSSTMGPGVRIDPNTQRALDDELAPVAS